MLRTPAGLVLVLAVLVACAVAAFPSARHQVALSAVRQPARYLAVSFSDVASARSCPGSSRPVAFDVANHLGRTLSTRYVVTVSTQDGAPSVLAGRLDLSDQGRRHVARTIAVPASGAYDVSVRVVGRPESLALHCGGSS